MLDLSSAPLVLCFKVFLCFFVLLYSILMPLVTFSSQLWAAGGHFRSTTLSHLLDAEMKWSLAAQQQMWLQVGLPWTSQY